MKSLVWTELGKVGVQDIDKPTIKNNTDVILKVSLSTICGSDVHIAEGMMGYEPPFPLGHEYMGVIEEVGSAVKNLKPGDRVSGPPAVYCGTCEACRKGAYGHCENGGIFGSGETVGGLDGAMSEYIRVPHAESCLVKVPDDITDEQALFVGDILTTGYSVIKDAKIQHGDTVAIFGVGPIGLCAVLAAKLYNPSKIIVIGRHDKTRTDLALELGADIALLCSEEPDVVAKIMELTDGKGVDEAIECAGSAKAVADATLAVTIGGRVAICGLFGGPVELPMQDICQKNITITMGLGDVSLMPTTLEMIKLGKFDTSKLITHRMPLADAEKAFEIFSKRTEPVIKIVLEP